MLDFCLDVFEKEYLEQGDSLILDKYTLANGLYLMVDPESGAIEKSEIITRGYNKDDEVMIEFSKLDYNSSLVSMNKPIASKSVVSNNYLSFFVKAERLMPKGTSYLKESEINQYFDALKNIEAKMNKDKRDREIYKKVLEEVGDIDEELLEKCRDWIVNNIYTIKDTYTVDKKLGYVKIFFKADSSLYVNEGKRYKYTKIFNNTKYNEEIDGIIYGVPANNFNFNEKKPYTKLKFRKQEMPFLASFERLIMIRKFYDYLMCLCDEGAKSLYVTEDKLEPFYDGEFPTQDISGVYLRLKKDMYDVEIVDCDIVDRYRDKLDIKIEEVIETFYEPKYAPGIRYGHISSLAEIRLFIDRTFYSGNLSRNLYTTAEDINKNKKISQNLKREIISTRYAYADWFYKGNNTKVQVFFAKNTMNMIIDSIKNGNYYKAVEQFNLRGAMLNYFENGGLDMKRRYKESYDNIVDGLIGGEIEFKNEDEYFFFVGQVSYYLLTKSKASTKTMDMFNVVETKRVSSLMQKFSRLKDKYRHAIYMDDKMMRLAISTVLDYKLDTEKVNLEALNCGYLYKNAIFEAKQIVRDEKNNGGNENE